MSAIVLETMQYSTELFYADFTEHKKLDIGISQWRQISSIEEEYADKRLTELYVEGKFSDQSWQISRSDSIHWGNFTKNHPDLYPLILTLKIDAFYRLQHLKKTISLYRNIPHFLRVFGESMSREGILAAQFNQPFVPASVITPEKINQWVYESVESKDMSLGSHGVLRLLDYKAFTPSSFFTSAPQLHMTSELPWSAFRADNDPKGKIGVYLSNIFGNENKRETKSYQPFSEEVIASVITPAINLIEKNSETLKCAFDLAAKPTSLMKNVNHVPKYTAKARDKLIGFHAELVKDFPDWPLGNKKYSLAQSKITDWYELAQGAALWIIMLTTGLRSVDTREHLFRDCYSQVPDSELMYYLLTDIQKTKIKDHPIPIPQTTVKAIDYLNSVNYAPEDVPQLVVRRRLDGNTKHWVYSSLSINNLLRRWATFCGQDVLDGLDVDDNQEGMAHRCRATMAGWIGTNSPISVLIVRRLFAHTNSVMPDHYLRGNKEVQKVRAEVRSKSYTDFANHMAQAIVDEKISGGVRNSMLEGKVHLKQLIVNEASRNNQSLTEGEIRLRLKERIKQILQNKLENGDMLALQTPLSFVCLRNPKSSTAAPCSIGLTKNKLLDQNIDRAFTTQLQMTGLPNLDNCKGASCQHSVLFDNPIAKILLEQFKYYTLYLRGIKHTNIDLDKEAQAFISLYTKPLTDVFPEVVKSIQGGYK